MTTEGEVEVSGDPRVRRPRAHEPLIEQLLAGNDGVFESKAEVMLFAAALGWSHERSEPFERGIDPIRFSVFEKMYQAETFIESLAVLNEPGNPEVLSEESLPDRIKIFEEYANGGLIILQGKINASRSTVRDVLVSLVREAANAGKEKTSKVHPDIRKLLTVPDWSSSE